MTMMESEDRKTCGPADLDIWPSAGLGGQVCEYRLASYNLATPDSHVGIRLCWDTAVQRGGAGTMESPSRLG